MKLIATITDPVVIVGILTCVGLGGPVPTATPGYASSGSGMRVQAKGGAGDPVRPSHCTAYGRQ